MSEIIVHEGMVKPSVQDLMDAADISRTHAYDILAGRQQPTTSDALAIYDKTGAQLGILNGLQRAAIEQIRQNITQDKAA